MGIAVPIDTLGSAGFRNLAANLTGPLSAGAALIPLAITNAGVIDVDWSARVPLLLITLKASLDDESLEVSVTLRDGAAGKPLPGLLFAPYSEAGASLLAHLPATDEKDSAAKFSLQLSARRTTPAGAAAVPPAQLRNLFAATMIEGQLGRLIYLLSAEKGRLSRLGREIQAMRRLSAAHKDALDRYGADLAVPRLGGNLVWDAQAKEIIGKTVLDAKGQPVPENDADYVRRLMIYRPFLLATRGRVDEMLNGVPNPAAPANNTGLPSGLGVRPRFILRESENRFSIAVYLFSAGAAQPRTNFLDYVRNTRLIWPQNNAAANGVHQARQIPPKTRVEIENLRTRLRQGFNWPANAAIAPALANALVRASRVSRALIPNLKWSVARAQDAGGGSRYELGLGVDITPPTAAQATDLLARVKNDQRPVTADAEAEALIAAIKAGKPAAGDDCAWLWQACGLDTVHRVNAQRLYLSHLPTRGMVVTGPQTGPLNVPVKLEVRYRAPGDPVRNAALLAAIKQADKAWQAAGHPPLQRLADADARARWARAQPLQAGENTALVFAGAGLPVVKTVAPVLAALANLPDELVETFVLEPALTNKIKANSNDAVASLSALVQVLRESGIAAALPLALDTGEIIMLTSVIGLPEAGININERRMTGFRWYVVPLGGDGEISPLGGSVALTPKQNGLFTVVVLGYVRTDQTDPYEVQVDLPDGAVLSPRQYEFVMNLLERICPAGVEINTFFMRKGHVDLDGDGRADPLRGSAARTYRRFVDRRGLGRYGAAEVP